MKMRLGKYLICAALAVMMLMPACTAMAEEQTDLEPTLITSASVQYYYFERIDALFEADNLYVLERNTCHVFDPSGKYLYDIDCGENQIDELAVSQGKIITLIGDEVTFDGTPVFGQYSHIAVCDDNVYLTDGDKIYELTNSGEQLEINPKLDPDDEVIALTATPDGFVYCLREHNYAIYRYENDKESFVYDTDKMPKKLGIIGDELYYLDNHDTLNSSNSEIYGVIAFCGGANGYYSTYKHDIISISDDKIIVASDSDEDYMFYQPCYVSSRFGAAYIADQYNNRVTKIEDDQISYITDVTRPMASSIDSMGRLYVAHSVNELSIFSENGELISSSTILSDEAVKQVVCMGVDTNNDVYLLVKTTAVSKILRYKQGTFAEVDSGDIKWLAFRPASSEMYVLSGNQIKCGENVVATTEDGCFCIDISGNIFSVGKDGVTNHTTHTVYPVAKKLGVSSYDRLFYSYIDSAHFAYGDIILTNSKSHAVASVSAVDVGAADINTVFAKPNIDDLDNARHNLGIVFRTASDCKLFEVPYEAKTLCSINAGDCVISLKEVDCPDQFTFVLYESAEYNKLYSGYIYRSALGASLPYSAPKNNPVKIVSPKAVVYRWPSVYSKQLSSNFMSGKTVTLLDFATNTVDAYGESWYVDNHGNKWYRVALDDVHEGYLLAVEVSVNSYTHDTYPNTNAVITQKAMLFVYDDSTAQYVILTMDGQEMWLDKDTRVQIETPFESSKKFTKVVFYRDGYGTIDIDCYVHTNCVSYDGVDIIKIIAVTASIIAVVAILVLIFIRRRTIDHAPANSASK